MKEPKASKLAESTPENQSGWMCSWMKHRQEIGPWILSVLFYFAFLIDAEPSKPKSIILAMIFILPPLVVGRMIWTVLTYIEPKEDSDDNISNNDRE